MIVVEYHQHIGAGMAGVGDGFKSHARGHGTIADDCDGAAVDTLLPGGDRHPQRSADTGAGMADAKGVVRAFLAFREACQPASLAHTQHTLATTGENFVGVTLVAHIPHQPVVGGVVDVVQGDGQLNNAEACAEVAAGLADRVQQKFTQLCRQLG